MLKKYRAKSHVSISVQLKNGKNVRVAFTPLTGGSSVYYTGDEELQEAIEQHMKFGHLFKIDEDNPMGKAASLKSEKSARREGGATADEGTAAVEPKEAEIEVACVDDAKDYLAEKFGVSRSKLRSRSQIDEVAAENKIKFIWK